MNQLNHLKTFSLQTASLRLFAEITPPNGRKVRLLLTLLVMLTATTAWAQDPQEPDLGYIVCNPANVIGGSLSFYKSFDSETGLRNEIAIDGTTHQSERLYSSELSDARDGYYRVYFKPNPDATHRLSDVAITIEKNGDSTQPLYWFVEGDYYFELPEDAEYVNVKATFADSFGTVLGDEGHPHVSYITFDNNGVKKTVRTDNPGHPLVYVVDGTETHLGKDGSDTWYIVKENLNFGVGYDGREATLTLDGHVHLILADGASMTVSNDSGNEHATLINGNRNYTIATYGQGGATEGKLTLDGNHFEEMLKQMPGLTINGGIIETSKDEIDCDLIIRGGKVTISCDDPDNDNAINNYTTTILGGQVTVNGKIEAQYITLGCATATDFIKANSYDIAWNGSLTIAPGQVLTYEGYTGDMLMGTLNDTQIAAIAGKTLTLDVEATNRTIVMNASGIRTFASVVDLDFSGIEGLTAYIVNAFDGTAGTLTLTSVEKVPAGTGLLLKGTASTTFVVPLAESTNDIGTNYLVGVTDGTTVVPMTTDDNTNFILANGGSGINWYTLSEAGSIGAYKAYLSLPTDELNLTGSAPSFTWVYGDGGATAIGEPSPDPSLLYGGEWYDLNGRKLDGKPTTKGLYIHNGRKEVVR